MNGQTKTRSVLRPGIVIGIGVGGFFDGIVFHQILQWHHMLSTIYPPDSIANLQIDTLADGLFHAAALIFTVIGVFWLWRAFGRTRTYFSTRILIAAIFIGWGAFNLVE